MFVSLDLIAKFSKFICFTALQQYLYDYEHVVYINPFTAYTQK